MVLTLESEPYSPHGSMAADGISKLLGSPNLDRLQVVIRETVQYSWDARTKGKIPDYRIRLFRSDLALRRTLSEKIFRNLPDEKFKDGRVHPIRRFLDSVDGWLMEISDFNTAGLGGPFWADQVPLPGESTNFVDFVRNVGSPRDRRLRGGTYGYGKSSLYALSRCRTILVHTVTNSRGALQDRLIACRIGQRFDTAKGPERGRFTGRHWWGANDPSRKGLVAPLTGKLAADFSRKLKLSERDSVNIGTSILILDPELATDVEENGAPVSAEDFGQKIRDTLLWYFWPKMIVRPNGRPAMKFRIVSEDKNIVLPNPAIEPGIAILCNSMEGIWSGSHEDTKKIECGRPKKHLGLMGIRSGIHKTRHESTLKTGIIPERLRHIALMRPAELVVDYLEGNDLLEENLEWGGAFRCDQAPEVEEAFAKSEPPAHDEWNPTYLWDKRERTFVKVALQRIREEMKDLVAPTGPGTGEQVGSVGDIGDHLGTMLLGMSGQGIGGGTGEGNGKGKKSGGNARIVGPFFDGYDMEYTPPAARYRVVYTPGAKTEIKLQASVKVVLDGATEDTAPNGEKPRFIGWEERGEIYENSTSVTMRGRQQRILYFLVSFPDYVALSARCRVEE